LALILAVLVAGSADGESDSRQVLKASDVLAKIGSGEPVEYTDVIIEGDLNPKNFPTEQVNRTNSQVESGSAKKVVKSPIKRASSEAMPASPGAGSTAMPASPGASSAAMPTS